LLTSLKAMDKKMKTLVGASAGVLVVILIVVIAVAVSGGEGQPVATTTLARTTLSRTVPLRGSVESLNVRDVSANLGLAVENVLVGVGDVVYEGQILAILDTTDLQLEMMLLQATLPNAVGAAVGAVDLDHPIQLALAQLEMAETAHANAMLDLHNDNHPMLVAGRFAVNVAREILENAESPEEANAAQTLYNEAQTGLVLVEAGLALAVEVARINLEIAQQASDALQGMTNLPGAGFQNMQDYMSEAQIITLLRLEHQLEEATIRAPISGTITYANARLGSPAQGLLFTIEDTNNLRIVASMREHDVASVGVGMGVDIRSDATGDSVFHGTIVSIDPSANHNPDGSVEFGAEISLDPRTPLAIGMTTRLNVNSEQRHGVFAVPFDAVATDEGGDHVFVVENGRAVRQSVQTGLEADFLLEIISPELTEGAVVINNANLVSSGMEVAVIP